MNPQFNFNREIQTGVKYLLIALLACYVLFSLPGLRALEDYLVLQSLKLYLWQNITYLFLHAGIGHLFGNLIGIFFIGSAVEAKMGMKRFYVYFIICGLGGALATHIAALFLGPIHVLGASGSVFGILYACYYFYPDEVVYVFFTFPVKIRWLLIGIGLFTFLMLFEPTDGVAHFAHFGGLLAGIAYFKFLPFCMQWIDHYKEKKNHIGKN